MIPRTLFQPEHEQFRESVRKFMETHAVLVNNTGHI